jgi:glucan endo-1,3-beta-D-glucosidase
VGLSVGSEDFYRLSESGIENKAGVSAGPSTIIPFIQSARSSPAGTILSNIPIGHVDSWSAWSNTSNSVVINEVDLLGMDVYPHYEKDIDNRIENAEQIFEKLHNKTTAVAGGKPVSITETGWPVSGPVSCNATASVDNARTFWDLITCKYLGRNNVWWYTLRDADPSISEKYVVQLICLDP